MRVENVLYIHGYVNLYGAEKSMLSLISELDRKKFCPFVILPKSGPLYKELKDLGVKCYRFPISVVNRYSNIFKVMGFFMMIIPSVAFVMLLIKLNKISIVHTNTSHVFIGAIAAKILRVKNVWHVREIAIASKIIVKALSLLIGMFSDRIIAVSQSTVKALFLPISYNKKVSIIYDGIDLEKYIPMEPISDGVFRVGLIGRITRWKGHLVFINAAAMVLKKYKNIKFYIIGEADTIYNFAYKDELKRIIQELGIEKDVEFLGFCMNMPRIYSLLDVSVISSILPDPCPNVALESMAMRKLIIASKIGGLPEILVKECAIFIPPNAFQALAEKIMLILHDPDKFHDLAQRGHWRAVECFGLKKYVNSITKLYSEMLCN